MESQKYSHQIAGWTLIINTLDGRATDDKHTLRLKQETGGLGRIFCELEIAGNAAELVPGFLDPSLSS